ncbi:MAG: hypothetical protein V4592_19315 [Bacteroidota bacterium]
MKALTKIKFYYLALLISFTISCGDKKLKESCIEQTISLEKIKLDSADFNVRYTSIQILKSYPIQKKCSNGIKYANLFICKRRLTQTSDTIYIFNECIEPPQVAVDTAINIETGFFARDIIKSSKKQVVLFVPEKFQIPANAKYLFTEITSTVL